MATVSEQLHHCSKLKKFQYRDCHVYLFHSVLCSLHGLSVPSIFHSPCISSANPASLPEPFTDYLIFILLKRQSNMSFLNFIPLHHRISNSPTHISPAYLLSQDKVTLVLLRPTIPTPLPTVFRNSFFLFWKSLSPYSLTFSPLSHCSFLT